MKKLPFQLISILMLFALGACQNEEIEAVEPSDRFTRIYNHENFNAAYYPLDMKQTADGGYLILGITEVSFSDFGGAYVMKVDAEGNFLWESPETEFVSPAPKLLELNGAYYFFCMDAMAAGSYLVRVDEASGTIGLTQGFEDINYPLAAATSPDGGMVVLGFERDRQSTALIKLRSDFEEDWTQRFDILEDPDELMFSHLTNPEKRQPFFVENLEGGGYFVNGMYNYTLSIMFVDQAGQPTGVMHGFRDDGAISAMAHLEGDQFALARYTFGKNYVHPKIGIDPAAISSSEDLEGPEFPELAPDADVRILKMTIEEREVVLYAANTKSNQVVLYAYDETEGTLLGNKYLGFADGYKIAAAQPTADGGMAILAQAYLAGRFPRIALFKISSGDLRELAEEKEPAEQEPTDGGEGNEGE